MRVFSVFSKGPKGTEVKLRDARWKRTRLNPHSAGLREFLLQLLQLSQGRALIFTKKSKFWTQTIPPHVPQTPCNCPWEQDKAKATAWHTRLSLAVSPGYLHAQHVISKGSFKHWDDTILLSVIPSRLYMWILICKYIYHSCNDYIWWWI